MNDSRKTVLFLCTGNSARSQMAEGILRQVASERFDVSSAGTAPKGVHPRTIEVLGEIGIDATGQASTNLLEFVNTKFDYVITVCDNAKEQCPVFPGAHSLHWSFDDPAAADDDRALEAFRRVRGEIETRIRKFLKSGK